MFFNFVDKAQTNALYISNDAESNGASYDLVKLDTSFRIFGNNCKKPFFFCLFRTRLPLSFLNLFV